MSRNARKILILSSLAVAFAGVGRGAIFSRDQGRFASRNPYTQLQTDLVAPARFTDATRASGVRFLHRNSATTSKYLIETMGAGAAMLDYDNDGWLDVFLTNGARLKETQRDGESPDKSSPEFWNRLFRNNHDGTFTDLTEKAGVRGKGYSMGVAVADYDNDGDADLLVTGYDVASLYRNNGDGTFTDVTTQSQVDVEGWMTSAGFFDYDNDGRLDILICRYLQWDFAGGSVFCGDNRPGGRGYCHPDKFKPISNYLFKNNSDGTFTDVSAASGIRASAGKALGVAFGDYNNDGWADIFVANDSHPQFLFKNNGDGTFTETGLIAGVSYSEDGKTFAGMGADFADIDDDGWPDVVATALPYEYYAFFRNLGNGGKSGFQYLSLDSGLGEITRLYGGWGVRVFDYDNDGAKDVFFANSHVMDNIARTQPHLSYEQRPLLLKFDGRRFTNVSSTSGENFTRASASRGAAFGDLDNDGDVDVVVANCNGPVMVLRNDGGNANHWVAVELRGVRSNRDGIGAKIVLTRQNGGRQYGVVSAAGSYLSANDRRVFLGLGNDSAIRRIRIEWPGGAVQEIPGPNADQILRVEEKVGAR
jgi:enediyne biosynthesis protein E4